jgi:type I restriction enzyme M protein
MLTNVDENGKTFEDQLPVKINREGEEVRTKSLKLDPVKIIQTSEDNAIELTEFQIQTFDTKQYSSLYDYYENALSPTVAQLDYKEANLKVYTDKSVYWYDTDKDTLIEATKGKQKELGCGKIIIKSSFKKATAKKEAFIEISVELTPDYQKDYEVISYSPDEEENQQLIADFMAKYVTKPFAYLDNVVGVEINFNKVFYKPEQLREVEAIIADLDALEKELKELEKELKV